MTKALLPSDVKQLKLLQAEFSEMFSWKVMVKVDQIAKHRMQKDSVKMIQESLKKKEPPNQII